ncbi:MAG: oligosaccharide flippase family protein [Pseudomonadota bacterium]|nr:oligosaccharide flippase family protein [Pseudomonadota bacterium]
MLKRLAAPYVVGVASRIVGQAISFATVAIASKFIDLDGFGTYAFGWALTVIATTFVFTGFYQALLRSSDAARDRSTLFWAMLGVGALGSLVITGVGLSMGGLATEAGRVILILAPLPFVNVPAAWWEAQLVRDARVRAASLYVLIYESMALLTVIVLLSMGWGVFALVASRVVAVAFGLLQTGLLVRKLPRFEFRRDTLTAARETAGPLWGTTSVALLSNYGADLILGALASPSVVGAYRGGARIAMTAADLVMQPLGLLSWSKFTRIEKEGTGIPALRRAWIENMSLAAALMWPMSMAVALLAPLLVVTILDETWLPAASIVSILAVSKSIEFFSNLLEPTMLTTGNAGRQLKIRSAGAVTLIVTLLAFGRFGPEAAAYCHLAASVVVGTASLVSTSKALEIPVRDMVVTFLPGATIAAFTFAIVEWSSGFWGVLGSDLGLGVTLVKVAVVWLILMAIFLRRRILVLPTP